MTRERLAPEAQQGLLALKVGRVIRVNEDLQVPRGPLGREDRKVQWVHRDSQGNEVSLGRLAPKALMDHREFKASQV